MATLHHLLPLKVVAAVAAVATAGVGAIVGSVRGTPDAPVAPSVPYSEAWARPPVVPAGDPNVVTDWEATSDSRVQVSFSYHRSDSGCGGPCERFQLTLQYREPSGGAAQGSARWQAVVAATCVPFRADGVADQVCQGGDELAGRDRHGTDYVLLPLYVTRKQLVRMAAFSAVVFDLAGSPFELSPAARGALRTLLGSAGRAVPR